MESLVEEKGHFGVVCGRHASGCHANHQCCWWWRRNLRTCLNEEKPFDIRQNLTWIHRARAFGSSTHYAYRFSQWTCLSWYLLSFFLFFYFYFYPFYLFLSPSFTLTFIFSPLLCFTAWGGVLEYLQAVTLLSRLRNHSLSDVVSYFPSLIRLPTSSLGQTKYTCC